MATLIKQALRKRFLPVLMRPTLIAGNEGKPQWMVTRRVPATRRTGSGGERGRALYAGRFWPSIRTGWYWGVLQQE